MAGDARGENLTRLMNEGPLYYQQLRLFAAIEMPEDWLKALARVRSQLEGAGGSEFRWVKTELMHLTLVFLGNQDADALPAISEAFLKAGRSVSPLHLSLDHLGSFGPPHALSVLWAGLAETPPGLKALHREITHGLADLGIPFDRKPLIPHVTIARGRRPPNREASLKVSSLLQRIDLPRLESWTDRFALIRSQLSPAGPHYETIQQFALGDGLD